jgi:polyhydroxyalkanoate synthesis regulator phasin
MRRFGIPNTENKYHQMTNLAIDLEAELRRSVILPKITQRYQEMQAWEYISRKKMEESNMVSRLQGEVDRLKRQMDRLEDKKYMWQKLKTEENMDEPSCPCFRERSLQKKVTGSCHLNPNDLRNSEDDGNERVQRNTEKQSTRAKLNASRSSISNLSTHDK